MCSSDLITATTVVSVFQQFHDNGSVFTSVSLGNCGQLSKKTAKAIRSRFPKAQIVVGWDEPDFSDDDSSDTEGE